MSAHPLIDGLTASAAAASAGILAIAQDLPVTPGEVGVGTAAIGFGIWLAKLAERGIGRLTDGIDKTTAAIAVNTAAQAEVAKQLALLMHETAESRRDGEQNGRQILAALADLPDRVADELKRNRTA